MAINIALDAMGGDDAPFVQVKGAELGIALKGITITLVGDEEKIRKYISPGQSSKITIFHCDKSVSMHEVISLSLLKEIDNSTRQTLVLAREGKADCALSAGNTSAFVSFAISEMGLMQNVQRPAIAAVLPTSTGLPLVFLDVGANIKPKPVHLLQYGVMGAVYAKKILGIPRPRVALLNIGEESTKGDSLRKESFSYLESYFAQKKDAVFTGNIEGQQIMLGKADVVVCDGFTGNAILKVVEGASKSFRTMLKKEIGKTFSGKMYSLFAKRSLTKIFCAADYAEYGGAILLGVNGIVVISHGRSSPKAILSAIKFSKSVIEKNFLFFLKKELESVEIG